MHLIKKIQQEKKSKILGNGDSQTSTITNNNDKEELSEKLSQKTEKANLEDEFCLKIKTIIEDKYSFMNSQAILQTHKLDSSIPSLIYLPSIFSKH